MKLSLVLTVVGIVLIFPSKLLAGHENGNGGGGIVCGNGPVQEVLFLDLWEAKVLKNISVRPEYLSTSQNLAGAIDSLRASKYAYVDEVESLSKQIMQQLDRQEGAITGGVEIQAPDDARTQFIKTGCKLQGIALYFDIYEKLFVDYQLFNKLSPQDKAALILHEAIYFGLRKHFSVSDSIAARGITGCAFSAMPCKELNVQAGVAADSLYCSDNLDDAEHQTLEFFASKTGAFWRLQFNRFDGEIVPTITYVDVSITKLNFRKFSDIYFHPEYSTTGLDSYITRTSDSMWNEIGLKKALSIGKTVLDDNHTIFEINGRSMIRCQKRS